MRASGLCKRVDTAELQQGSSATSHTMKGPVFQDQLSARLAELSGVSLF
jgi:hypothetical protein